MKISVIVPVYKVEQYLSKCVNSLLEQTYKDIEVILVDDGSPDKCPKICDDYAQQNSNIIVIHKKNGGLSDARNAGIKAATGDFLYFIDSDDYLDNNNLFSEIVALIQAKEPDIVVFGAKKDVDGIIIGNDISNYSELEQKTPIDTIVNSVKNDHLSISACSMFIKRDYIINNALFFRYGIKSEDIEWGFRLYAHVPNLCYYDRRSYIYRLREGSITHTIDYQHLLTYLSIIEEKINVVSEYEGKLRKALLGYAMYHLIILIGLTTRVRLRSQERAFLNKRLKVILRKYLLQNTLSQKVGMAACVYRVLGYYGMRFVLGQYMKVYKNK